MAINSWQRKQNKKQLQHYANKPKSFKYKVELNECTDEITQWLNDNIGQNRWNIKMPSALEMAWSRHSSALLTFTYGFVKDTDAVAFKLRWL